MNDIMALLPDIKLRFNIEHPSLEECYVFGYECAVADISEEENPYRLSSKESEQWVEGWWAGFYGEIPLYDVAAADHETVQSVSDSESKAANDHVYQEHFGAFFMTVMEITGIILVSAAVGYQVLDLVA